MQNKMGETKSLVYKIKMADDSVRPTKRAADSGDWSPFSGSLLALNFFCSQAESTLRPAAANAHRWAS
jgi:hypothetical protein